MKDLVFVLMVYGIVNIAVFGSIFEKWRQFWLRLSPTFWGKLMTCPICLGFWIGIVLSTTFYYMGYSSPFSEYGVKYIPLMIFLDGCFSSACTWLIHSLQEMLERAFVK